MKLPKAFKFPVVTSDGLKGFASVAVEAKPGNANVIILGPITIRPRRLERRIEMEIARRQTRGVST